MLKFLAKKSFAKIFKNLAAEMNEPVSNVQIGITYSLGSHKYFAYRAFKKEKEITLDDYCGAITDLSGGTQVIEATIAQAGPKYAKEMSQKYAKEVFTDKVAVIMAHKDGDFPMAVLLHEGKKERNIDIEREFLSE